MWEDPIVAEVRKQRRRLFAGFNYDLEAYVEHLKARQQEREQDPEPSHGRNPWPHEPSASHPLPYARAGVRLRSTRSRAQRFSG